MGSGPQGPQGPQLGPIPHKKKVEFIGWATQPGYFFGGVDFLENLDGLFEYLASS